VKKEEVQQNLKIHIHTQQNRITRWTHTTRHDNIIFHQFHDTLTPQNGRIIVNAVNKSF
ncbi:MAG: hypothetical protein ACI8RD_008391, partial [Bacillariaceae sp.]